MQAQACDRCHLRKSKCSKERPSCVECRKAHANCCYTDRTKEPLVRKGQLDAIEQRLRHSEAKNEALSAELRKLRAEKVSGTRASSIPTSHNGQGVESNSTKGDSTTGQFDLTKATECSLQNSSGGDIISEVSLLASNAAGGRHFLGSTSGVLFAKLVRASIDITSAQQDESDVERFGPDTSIDISCQDGNTGLGKEALPSEELSRKLVYSYLGHDHLACPFLLPSFVLSVLNKVYGETNFYSVNHFEAFVFDMILAIANASVYKYDWHMLPSAESHYARAMTRIGEVLPAGGLESLQAILLLCQYRTGSSMQDTSASMWHLVGIAVRTAYELGLHHESSYSIPTRLSPQDARVAMRQQELRRRCYWSVFCMDRVVSITLGRPLAINMEDVDVEIPSLEHESIFNDEFTQPDQCLKRTAIFVHIIRYRLLCGKIMRSLHGLRRATNHDDGDIYKLRDTLSAELDVWWAKTPELGLPQTNTSATGSQRSTFQSNEWYEVLYRNASLMLFRPSPMLSDISKDPKTLQNIFIASKQAILLYASLHRSRKINYSWITLHSVFMAGLSYIYAVSRHFRERRRRSSTGAMLPADPSTIEIVNDTRACSNVLVAVSERWNASRHCHEVFDRLSDAVLEDSIKLQTGARPAVNPQPPNANISAQTFLPANQIPDSNVMYNADQMQSWFENNSNTAVPPVTYSQTSPLAVDYEFRSCFGDLQRFYQQHNDDPVIQLSQDWLGYLDNFDQFLPIQSESSISSTFT